MTDQKTAAPAAETKPAAVSAPKKTAAPAAKKTTSKKSAPVVKNEAVNPRVLLYRKMTKAAEELKNIPKNGFNDFHKYSYVREEDVLATAKPVLLRNGLFVTFTTIEERRETQGNSDITTVMLEFTITDIDTGEQLMSKVPGQGTDKGDKGVYKAITGATKYFLTKMFLISTGEDPEGDTSVDQSQQSYTPQPKQSAPAPQAAASHNPPAGNKASYQPVAGDDKLVAARRAMLIPIVQQGKLKVTIPVQQMTAQQVQNAYEAYMQTLGKGKR